MKSPRFQGNKIFFSGITPGGYLGEDAKIMSVLFVAKKVGETSLNIENGEFLLNDDNGTEDSLKVNNLSLTILEINNCKAIIVPAEITVTCSASKAHFGLLINIDKNELTALFTGVMSIYSFKYQSTVSNI